MKMLLAGFVLMIVSVASYGDMLTANKKCKVTIVSGMAQTTRVTCENEGIGEVVFFSDKDASFASRCHEQALLALAPESRYELRVLVNGRKGEGGYHSAICELVLKQ